MRHYRDYTTTRNFCSLRILKSYNALEALKIGSRFLNGIYIAVTICVSARGIVIFTRRPGNAFSAAMAP